MDVDEGVANTQIRLWAGYVFKIGPKQCYHADQGVAGITDANLGSGGTISANKGLGGPWIRLCSGRDYECR